MRIYSKLGEIITRTDLLIYPMTLVLIFIIALFHTVDSFNPGYIASWDGPAHLVRAEHFYNSLNSKALGIWGWYHGWYLGVAPFMFYSPGFFMVLSLLTIISFGLVPMQFIIKIVLAFTYALFPIVLYWLSTTIGFSKRTSIMASILSLVFSGVWVIGLTGLYSIGLYTNIFSLLPFMLFLGALHKTLTGKGSPIITGLLLGFIVITNMVTAVYSIIVVFIYILSLLVTRKKVKWTEISQFSAIGILSSLFWTFPFLSSRNLFGIETGFSPFELTELIKKLFLGQIIFHPAVSAFLILGTSFSLWTIYKKRSKSFPYIFIISLFGVTVLISSALLADLTLSWQNSNEILQMISKMFRSILRSRSLLFLWIIIPIIGAIGINSILEILNKYTNKKIVDKISIIVLLSLLLFSYTQLSIISEKNVKTTEHNEYKKNYEEWDSAFEWLKTNAPKNSVVLTDIKWDRFNSPGTFSIDSLINLEAGLRTVNGNQIEASQVNTRYLNTMEFKETKEDKNELHKFNVDYVFSYRKPKYETSYLKEVYNSKDIIIYKTVDLTGPYEIMKYDLGSNKYHMKINVFTNTKIELPLQYNNHWRATVNGKNVEIEQGNAGLVELNLKNGLNDITLEFKKTPTEFVAFLISLFTIVFCSLYLLYNNYRYGDRRDSGSFGAFIIRRTIKTFFYILLVGILIILLYNFYDYDKSEVSHDGTIAPKWENVSYTQVVGNDTTAPKKERTPHPEVSGDDTTAPRLMIFSPENITYMSSVPEVNTVSDESCSFIYSWDGEGNITGPQNMFNLRVQKGEFTNDSDRSIVLELHMNENMGSTAHDDSGNGNHGILDNVDWAAAGRFGSAAEYDGTKSYINILDNPSLRISGTGLSISAWVWTDYGIWRPIVRKGANGLTNYVLLITPDNKLRLAFDNMTGSPIDSIRPVPLNRWTHVAGVYDGTALSLYIDGVFDSRKDVSGSPVSTSTQDLTIGREIDQDNWFNGYLDDIIIWNRPLSAAEIKRVYNSEQIKGGHYIDVYCKDRQGNAGHSRQYFSIK